MAPVSQFLQFLPTAAIWLIPPIICLDKGKRLIGVWGLLAPFAASVIGFAAGAVIWFSSDDVQDNGWDELGAFLGALLVGVGIWVLVVVGAIAAAVVGAIRLARPDSGWARRRYDEAKMAEARARFT